MEHIPSENLFVKGQTHGNRLFFDFVEPNKFTKTNTNNYHNDQNGDYYKFDDYEKMFDFQTLSSVEICRQIQKKINLSN